MQYGLPCKKSELVCVAWEDACDHGRIHRDDVRTVKLVVNRNIGWIAHQDESRIVLAWGDSESGEIEQIVIPTKNVLEITYLVSKRKRTEDKDGKENEPAS